jgi:hypothetical protein
MYTDRAARIAMRGRVCDGFFLPRMLRISRIHADRSVAGGAGGSRNVRGLMTDASRCAPERVLLTVTVVGHATVEEPESVLTDVFTNLVACPDVRADIIGSDALKGIQHVSDDGSNLSVA